MSYALPAAVLISLLYACSNAVPAAEETSETAQADTGLIFSWETELCSHSGRYRPERYTAEQLEATHQLWFHHSGIILDADATPSKPEDIARLDTQALGLEYREKKNSLNQLRLVPDAYWEKLRSDIHAELDEEYALKTISILAWQNPQLLLESRYAAACADYVQALNSADSSVLLDAWKTLVLKQSRNNGSPARVLADYEQKLATPQRLLWARIELSTYGWWNCANAQTFQVQQDTVMENRFNKLFSNVQSDCLEP